MLIRGPCGVLAPQWRCYVSSSLKSSICIGRVLKINGVPQTCGRGSNRPHSVSPVVRARIPCRHSIIMSLKAPICQSAALTGKRPSCRLSPRSSCRPVMARAQAKQGGEAINRRQVLDGAAALSVVLLATPKMALAAKAPSGFTAVEDMSDGYKFFYPFGWQEVQVSGADVVFKDVVEPLESVSVTMIRTDKADISEYGSVEQVSETLAKQVLTAPGTDVKLLSTTERADEKGRKYFELEFTAASPNFTRHQLAVVAVSNGKFYTLTTGSSERRWGKMKDKLNSTIRSFTILF